MTKIPTAKLAHTCLEEKSEAFRGTAGIWIMAFTMAGTTEASLNSMGSEAFGKWITPHGCRDQDQAQARSQ